MNQIYQRLKRIPQKPLRRKIMPPLEMSLFSLMTLRGNIPHPDWSNIMGALRIAPVLAVIYDTDERRTSLNTLSPSIQDAESPANRRSWRLPGYFRQNIPDRDNQRTGFDEQVFVTSQNAILLRKSLIEAFHGNKFGVDVDDDYRFICFPGVENLSLPSHVPHAQAETFDPSLKYFLRKHFSWSLRVHICEGSVRDDFSDKEVEDTLRALGIGSDPEISLAEEDDPLWETEIGKLVYEMYMESQFEYREALEDSHAYSGS
ncbi:hypothetical protein SISNIDRAFT_487831 [Sistotremastrum niveocremeum HHB9708]|uniref:Uncharacterized protein n=1 Tax=Sistotremastrum niveocremeum HHB9708 TaxID=1314777 RepID=A0A164S468_9AGAM|nr:hypothetical protein SISNIDRAFT_487831 [Sistotremastrum niveocremeum HHB9708]